MKNRIRFYKSFSKALHFAENLSSQYFWYLRCVFEETNIVGWAVVYGYNEKTEL